MDRPSDARAAPAAAARNVAAWVLVVQCLLALSWTLYVLFLPAMLSAAGIERRWFVYVLIADQLIFAACDWAAGAHADRIGGTRLRVGRTITVVTLLSSAAFLAMPWVAQRGHAAALLTVIFVWAATSSALRAPVFALLGRIRESPVTADAAQDGDVDAARRVQADLGTTRAGSVALALVGISVAGAIGPYLTVLLKNADGRLPLAISALSLAVASLFATRIEAILPHATAAQRPTPDEVRTHRRRAVSLAGAVLVAAFGTQVLTAIVVQPLLARFVGADAVLWAAWFWVGFAAGLVPGFRLARARASRWTRHPLTGGALALVIGSAAAAGGAVGDALALLVAGIALAGVAWGVFTTVAFASAVSLSGGRGTARGIGTASGMLFSALAVGTLMRLGLVAAGTQRAPLTAWLPELAWLLASALLVACAATVWRRSPDEPATRR